MLVSFPHLHQLTPELPPKKPLSVLRASFSLLFLIYAEQLPQSTAIPYQGYLLLLFVRSIQLEIRIFSSDI